MRKDLRFLFVLVAGIALVSGVLLAQSRERGVIQGKVTDSEGLALPGVTVTASSLSLMGTRTTITDQEGKYRFPVLVGGIYIIEASVEGFASMKKTEVELHVGMTVTVDFALTPAKIETEITVVGAAPLVDITDASTGKIFMTKDWLQNIPTNQSAADLLNFAPGVIGSDGFSNAYGGSNSSNSYSLDGAELTDAWYGGGVYTTPIDYNTVEESQIITLGAPAEYGNFTGATVNIVTKSGGNKFSGDAQVLYQGYTWQSKNKDINENDDYWSLLPESPETRLADPSFRLGGPILKDRLWFFTSFEYHSMKQQMKSTGRSSPETWPKIFLKLTFQPDQKNKLQTFFTYHNREWSRTSLDTLTDASAQGDMMTPIYVGNLSFLHTFSSSTLFEIKVAGYSMKWDSIPSSRNRDIAGHYDLFTGRTWGNLYFWSHWTSSRYTFATALSSSIDDFISGSHEVKIGLEIEKSEGGGTFDYNGPDKVVYYDWDGAPYLAEKSAYKEWGVNWRYSLYAQDSWKIAESLVFNPGLRFDIIRGSVPDLAQPDKTTYKPTGLAPRIGFVWDVLKDHKTLLKGHYGRYYEGTKTYYFAQMTPMSDTTYYSVGPDWSSLTELYTIPGLDLYTIDPKIKHPCADEFVAGAEQVLGKDLSATVSLIYRNWINLVDAVNTGGIFEPVSYLDPETGQSYTIYNELNPGADHYYITNPEKGKDIGAAYPDIVQFTPNRKYRALQITLAKRFSHNWQLYASYVYSYEKGSYSSDEIPSMSTIFYDPNNQINNYGYSSTSIPHVLKIQGTYFLPWGFSLSAFYNLYSGSTWTKQLVISDLNQGAVYILAEPRGSRRLAATNNLDLRVEKSLSYKNSRLSLMLDVFNLFNRGIVTYLYYYSGSNFGKPRDVNTPRSYRVGVRLFF